jgi:hypothetical protein
MKTSIFVLLASLATSPVTPAALPDDVETIRYLHRVYGHAQRAVETKGTEPDATARLPAGAFVSGPQPYPFGEHRTDGLSRNPDDCLRYGCIDNQ